MRPEQEQIGKEIFRQARVAVLAAMSGRPFLGAEFNEDDLVTDVATDFWAWWQGRGAPEPPPFGALWEIARNAVAQRGRQSSRKRRAYEWLASNATVGHTLIDEPHEDDMSQVRRRFGQLAAALAGNPAAVAQFHLMHPEADKASALVALNIEDGAYRKAAWKLREEYARLLQEEDEEQGFRAQLHKIIGEPDPAAADAFTAGVPARLKVWAHICVAGAFDIWAAARDGTRAGWFGWCLQFGFQHASHAAEIAATDHNRLACAWSAYQIGTHVVGASLSDPVDGFDLIVQALCWVARHPAQDPLVAAALQFATDCENVGTRQSRYGKLGRLGECGSDLRLALLRYAELYPPRSETTEEFGLSPTAELGVVVPPIVSIWGRLRKRLQT